MGLLWDGVGRFFVKIMGVQVAVAYFKKWKKRQ